MSSGIRLHHVGYAVKGIEAAADVYVRRYGYTVCTGVIHDPLQTAFVQFLKLEGDSSYLELVAPDGPASKLTMSVKRGGSFHHLCYSCGPLEQTIEELEATGMKLISDPKPAVAFGGRRICWLFGEDQMAVELVERRGDGDLCVPGL
jgi:methylmalonyl-CoA/ethylmalonyl-CoA epimerase